MKNSTALIALLLAFSISIEQASAQVSVSNPKEHALLLVDQLRKDGIQSFTESITTTIGHKEAAATLLAHLAPFDKQIAKFSAVALDRDYGGAIRNIVIYQYYASQNLPPFIYLRFVYKMTDSGWRLTSFQYNSEITEPFPANFGIH